MRRLTEAEKQSTLITGKRNLKLEYFRNSAIYEHPLWERLLNTAFFFLMGLVQVFAGITGIYFDEAIIRIGTWMVNSSYRIRSWFGIKRDPELSRRIIDPRFRAAALEAIAESRKILRDRNKK